MLVLTRKKGERVRITTPDGTVVWVMLVDPAKGRTRIGVQAPAGVQILREEMCAAVDAMGGLKKKEELP